MCIACRRKWRNHHDIYDCEEIGRPVTWKLRGYYEMWLWRYDRNNDLIANIHHNLM